MSGFQLQRLGLIMEPKNGNAQEIEGILNPAAAAVPTVTCISSQD